ncbi:MAG: protein-glutamate O-methyltransferase CheR [Deltaproteobacteria bacterium]|nr:protein-glutamate O-methyltransferase CheR [Deltaproteobacteria bacterium]
MISLDNNIKQPYELIESEFKLFQRLVYREAGIFLGDAKRALVAGRLSSRVKELGLPNFSAYHRLVTKGNTDELATMLDCICTNETHFFREAHHFEFLANTWLPARIKAALYGGSRKIHIWSAGCSTGEEPYSIAMVLLDKLCGQGYWDIEILATDLSRRALNQARLGIWNIDRASEINEYYLKKYMLRGVNLKSKWMKASNALRKIIRFERMNLNDTIYEYIDTFDLIFCRNVLIYFDNTSRNAVIERLLSYLAHAGYLFLGHAETINGLNSQLYAVAHSVYTREQNKSVLPETGIT